MQIEANGITLDYESYGDTNAAETVILIRGLGTQRIHWPAELLDGMASSGRRVITFDNRDVGLSRRFDNKDMPAKAGDIERYVNTGKSITPPYALEDLAKDVVGLMDALGIARAHIFGISMGGMIAQILALKHPNRLLTNTIVMSAARPLVARAHVGQLLPQLVAHDPTTIEEAEEALLTEYENWGSPGYPAPESYIRALARTAYGRGGPAAEGINRQLLALLDSEDRRASLKTSTTHSCIIHGREDTLIPYTFGEEIASCLEASELHILDGMGHIITPSLSPVIAQIWMDFLENPSRSVL